MSLNKECVFELKYDKRNELNKSILVQQFGNPNE